MLKTLKARKYTGASHFRLLAAAPCCSSLAQLSCLFMLLGVVVIVQLVVSIHWALGTATAAPATSYQLTYVGAATSSYSVAQPYHHFHINHTVPVPSALRKAAYKARNQSCWEIAASHSEPYTSFYHPTNQPVQPLPGAIPRAAYQWSGRISRQLFESVPFELRDQDTCPHCTYVLRYKVLGERLYTHSKRRHRALDGQEQEAELLEELMLAALHLYKVPDADYLLHLGDGCPEGLPLLQANINRAYPRAGFAVPKFMWRDALGPEQLNMYAECLEARYPRQQQLRTPHVVWRGSSTDSSHALVEESSVLDLVRVRVALMGRWYPLLLDTALVAYVQQAFNGQCTETLLPLGSRLQLEEYNRFAFILDVDGNGWSDRYRLLAHMNTPVLKQASNLTAYFEHLVAPGAIVEHFAHDASDLPIRAQQLLQAAATPAGQQQLQQMVQQQQGLAHHHLNHVAVAAAMAAAITKVSELSSWSVVQEEGYELVPPSKCCTHAKALPAELVAAVKAGAAAGAGATPTLTAAA